MSQKHVLTARQNQILQQFVWGKEYAISEVSEFKTATDISLATLKRDLTAIIAIGYLNLLGKGKVAKYVLTSYGLLNRQFQDNYFEDLELRKNCLKSYNFDLLKILENENLFSNEEIVSLEEGTKKFKSKSFGKTITIHNKELERFVIELSWKSSKIEGNTYTLLDTEKLIRDGIEADGHPKEEAVMILNHKYAFKYIIESIRAGKDLQNFRELENIHRLLIEGLGVNHGIRSTAVGITGTKYLPLELRSQIEEEMKTMIDILKIKNTFYTKGLLSVLFLSYLQGFEDGNKRTARLFANAMLLQGGLAPLSYRDVDEKKYREAMLIFYEQNSLQAFKEIFIEQYIFACENYNIA